MHLLGLLAHNQGQPEEATRFFEQAFPILREVGNRVEVSIALTNLGSLALGRGQHEEAKRFYEQALAIDRELDNRSRESLLLFLLGATAQGRGQPEKANRWYQQALPLLEESGWEEQVQAVRKSLAAHGTKQRWWQRKH